MKPNCKCAVCNKLIYRRPSNQNGHNVCSYGCRNKYYSGKRSFVFKHGKAIDGGRDTFRDRVRDKLRKVSFKVKAIKLLGGKCVICGYNTCIAALEFHHKNPKLKDKSFKEISNRTWSKTLKELKKCILLCANCHRELHWKEKHGQEFRREVDEYLSTYIPRKR